MKTVPRIAITGMSCILPIGKNLSECCRYMKKARGGGNTEQFLSFRFGGRPVGVIPDQYFGESATPMERRFNDRITTLVCDVVGQCIHSSELSGKEIMASTGIMSGSAFGCLDSGDRFLRVLHEKGPAYIDPLEFPWTSHNYPISAAAIKYGLKGPITAVVASVSSGLNALIYAARQIIKRQVPRMLVVAFDEINDLIYAFLEEKQYLNGLSGNEDRKEKKCVHPFEGCAAVMLESIESANARGAVAVGEIRGWHIGSGTAGRLNARAVCSSINTAAQKSDVNNYGVCVIGNGSGCTKEWNTEKQAIKLLAQQQSFFCDYIHLKPEIGGYLGAAGLVETILVLALSRENEKIGFGGPVQLTPTVPDGRPPMYIINSFGLDSNIISLGFLPGERPGR